VCEIIKRCQQRKSNFKAPLSCAASKEPAARQLQGFPAQAKPSLSAHRIRHLASSSVEIGLLPRNMVYVWDLSSFGISSYQRTVLGGLWNVSVSDATQSESIYCTREATAPAATAVQNADVWIIPWKDAFKTCDAKPTPKQALSGKQKIAVAWIALFPERRKWIFSQVSKLRKQRWCSRHACHVKIPSNLRVQLGTHQDDFHPSITKTVPVSASRKTVARSTQKSSCARQANKFDKINPCWENPRFNEVWHLNDQPSRTKNNSCRLRYSFSGRCMPRSPLHISRANWETSFLMRCI